MTARSRLTQPEINAVLRSLRNLDSKKSMNGEVIATTGEILLQDEEHEFLRDTATDDTRVKTAISWLEEATILSRHENEVTVFPASLQIQSMEEARRRIFSLDDADYSYKQQLVQIVRRLVNADSDEGITTDELSGITGLTSEGIRNAMTELARIGLVSNDAILTAYVHRGVQRPSRERLTRSSAMEEDLITLMQEQAPDQAVGETQPLHLRQTSQYLKGPGPSVCTALAGAAKPEEHCRRRTGRISGHREHEGAHQTERGHAGHPAQGLEHHPEKCAGQAPSL